MIRLLSVAWYKILPAKYGGQKGIAFFNEYLARHFPLVCLCSVNNETDRTLPYKLLPKLPVTKFQFISPGSWKLIRQTMVEEKSTHLVLEHHAHNIESQRFRQLGRFTWPLLAAYEKWTMRHADLCLFKTEEDAQWAAKQFDIPAERSMIAPYGTDIRPPQVRSIAGRLIRERHAILPHEKVLLFAGTLDYLPNARAVETIYKEIAPRLVALDPHFRIIICGRNKEKAFRYLTTFNHERVIMAGEVPDIEGYFEAADVFINPVHSGGGMQTKNIDALARNCTVVSFAGWTDRQLQSLAAEKIFITEDGNWEQFVQQIRKAAQHRVITPPAFYDHYHWAAITRRVAERIHVL